MKPLRYAVLFLTTAMLPFLVGSKKEAALPPATSTGANIFGCKINGQVFYLIYEPSVRIYPVVGGFYSDVDNNVWIYIHTSRYDSFLDICIKKVNGPGVYYLNINTWPMPYATWPDNYGYYAKRNGNTTIDYYILYQSEIYRKSNFNGCR